MIIGPIEYGLLYYRYISVNSNGYFSIEHKRVPLVVVIVIVEVGTYLFIRMIIGI